MDKFKSDARDWYGEEVLNGSKKSEIELKKFGMTDSINGEKTLDISLKINSKVSDWLKDIAKIKPQFVPETVEPSEWFDKAQKKQIEEMNDIARNSMQCCMPKHSLCDTCLYLPQCPIQYTSVVDKCEIYKKLPNSIEDLINAYPLCETCKKIWKCPEKSDNYKAEKTSCGSYEPLFKFKEEIKMESWKERLKEEYTQLKERYEKLKAYNNKKEVEAYLLKDVAEEPEDMYSRVLLKKQQSAMGEYLHILELRAELAHIEL